jgi:hypothetical protein
MVQHAPLKGDLGSECRQKNYFLTKEIYISDNPGCLFIEEFARGILK